MHLLENINKNSTIRFLGVKKMKVSFYVHGLWLIASVLFFIGAAIAGNLEYVEGTTQTSYALAILIAFLFFFFATALVISAAINARQEGV